MKAMDPRLLRDSAEGERQAAVVPTSSNVPRLGELCIKELQKHHGSLEQLVHALQEKQHPEGALNTIAKLWMHNHPVFRFLEQRFPFVEIQTIKGHNDSWIDNCCWSPDGNYLATIENKNKRIAIWNAATGKEVQTCVLNECINPPGHISILISWSPDSKCLAAAEYKGKKVTLWNVATGECLKTFEHDTYINALSWNPNGSVLAVREGENRLDTRVTIPCHLGPRTEVYNVQIWDVATGECLQTIPSYYYDYGEIVWSPDGQLLGTRTDDRTAKIWDVATGECLYELIHEHDLYAIAWSPNGQWIASRSGCSSLENGTVQIFDAATGACVERQSRSVNYFAWSPDSKCVIIIGIFQTVEIWDVERGITTTLRHHDGSRYESIKCISCSPDGKWIAIGFDNNGDYKGEIWHVETLYLRLRMCPRGCKWSPDGKRLVLYSDYDGCARIFAQGDALRNITSYDKAIKLEQAYQRRFGHA